MNKLINYLIDCADDYDLDIIDDSENHNMIFVRFPNPTTILCYNTETHDYIVCYEDDLEIGYIKANAIDEPYIRRL